MRLRTHSRTQRLFRRLPRFSALPAGELLLLILIAVQAARLVWTLVTPVGPIGDWRPAGAIAAPGGDAALAEFDPFFRLSAGGGPAAVTALNLKLYGVREDRATGRGSAIIALPDGTQRSFAVGEEVMPGVRLTQVGFESVTIDRNGVAEQIFLDQSEPAPPTAGAPPMAPPMAPPSRPVQAVPNASPTPPAPAAPRPLAGMAPGDIIVSVNGQPVGSQGEALAAVRAAGGTVNVIVNRGGRAVPIPVRPNP